MSWNELKEIFNKFFWGHLGDQRKLIWSSWDSICYPTEEGGFGVRRIQDVVQSFQLKMWWRFRNQNSLWSHFLLDKYCKGSHPVTVKPSYIASANWKRMCRNRKEAENHLFWSIGKGELSFCLITGLATNLCTRYSLSTLGTPLQSMRIGKTILGITANFKKFCQQMNDVKHRNKKFNPERIIWKVHQHIVTISKTKIAKGLNWKGDRHFAKSIGLDIGSSYKPKLKIVKWTKPEAGWIKINTDGASKGNPGVAGAGGIARNEEGAVIFAFYETLGEANNSFAEVFGLFKALQICQTEGLPRVWIEIPLGAFHGGWNEEHTKTATTSLSLFSVFVPAFATALMLLFLLWSWCTSCIGNILLLFLPLLCFICRQKMKRNSQPFAYFKLLHFCCYYRFIPTAKSNKEPFQGIAQTGSFYYLNHLVDESMNFSACDVFASAATSVSTALHLYFLSIASPLQTSTAAATTQFRALFLH
ncbi:UNVERIFIED_CONTAM: putative ribonuclease H protein [Sesamum radiatum]|uniref:Ribonuclease H protein n=1 Tax=Sesamum radiatum TaxID=300843 RepID=A0AAW2PN38_SESRA